MSAVLQNSTLSTLSPVQAQVIQALAQGTTITAAARIAGVHRSTLYNWFDQPAFSAAVREAQQECSDCLRDELQELAALALSQLRALLESPDTPPSVRLRACLAVLDQRRWTLPQRNEPNSAPQPTPFLRNEPKNDESVDSKGPSVLPKLAVLQNSTDSTPRNAPCPCGSGLKFKRCCGAGAPPVLHSKTALKSVR